MHIEEHSWHSPVLGRDMSLKVYGHWGDPFIVFPCSRGRYFDYEGMGMVAAIASFLFFFKHPDLFQGTIALSGLYRLDRAEFGLGPDDLSAVYFNSPLTYLSGRCAHPRSVQATHHHRMRRTRRLGRRGAGRHPSPGKHLPGKGHPGLDRHLGARCQPRLAVVVPADESFSGTPLSLTKMQIMLLS
jgi:hypothetical protein